MRQSKDVERQAPTDFVGASMAVLHDTATNDLSLILFVATANGESADKWGAENLLYAIWKIDDEALKEAVAGGRKTFGELLDYVKISSDGQDRDMPGSSSNGLSLTSVSVNASYVPEDHAAGYDGTTQEIGYDSTGLYGEVWTFQNGGATQNKTRAYSEVQPAEFDGVVNQFTSHMPYARDAIAAAIG